jgi:hypothetical protein
MDMSDRYRLRNNSPDIWKHQQIFPRWTPTFSKRQLTVGQKLRHMAHERLDIVLSVFCPDICPWDDITVALPVFMYGQN